MYLEDGYCTSSGINLDPDDGCLTYSPLDDIAIDGEDWDEEMEADWDDAEDVDLYLDDDEEDWEDDDY
jgi:hypothetical protein